MITNTRLGLTGFLTPEGKFVRCKYGCHSELATKLISKDEELRVKKIMQGIMFNEEALQEFLYVPMGSMGKHFESASHFCPPLKGDFTEAQIKWLKKNYHKLDETQQELLNDYGSIAGWEGI